MSQQPRSHGLRFGATCFWVIHRRREYGPFDYEWSRDLGGIELTYCGIKFGEYCGPNEIFADLKDFQLPLTVVKVASIVLGCIVHGIVNSRGSQERQRLMAEHLHAGGYARFATDF